MTKLVQNDSKSFSPKYFGDKTEKKFDTTFRQINNRGSDIEIDEIIIFDGGDVNGYEKDLTNSI